MELSLKALWQPIIQLETVNSACDFPQDTVGKFVFDGPTTHTLWPIRMCLLLERKTGCLEIMLRVSLHEIGDALDVLTNCVSICQLVSLFVTGLTVLKLYALSLYISSPRFLKKKTINSTCGRQSFVVSQRASSFCLLWNVGSTTKQKQSVLIGSETTEDQTDDSLESKWAASLESKMYNKDLDIVVMMQSPWCKCWLEAKSELRQVCVAASGDSASHSLH